MMQPDPQRVSRRTLFRVAGAVAAGVPAVGIADGLLVTPRWLSTSAVRCGEDGPAGRVRVLQISDLHLRRIGVLEERLLAAVHEARADLIVFSGDIIDRPNSLWPLEMLLREFPTGPLMMAIPGNWEHRCGVRLEALDRTYDRHNVQLLVNRSVEVELGGRRMRITGLDDLVAGHPDAALALRDKRPLPDHLLLAHCPATRDAVAIPADHPASLILSGHTHGGQIAPLGCALIRPIGSGRYLAGWYRDPGQPPMYVSRGIGTSLVPMRIGAAPELVQIDWGCDTATSQAGGA